MVRIAFIGAGSMTFATKLAGDILSFPEFTDAELALMDIDEQRLAGTEQLVRAMIEKENLDATVEATTDQGEALEGADYVLSMINVGGVEPFENEIRIPERYGVEQAIGDTIGPGGIFRALRTLPDMLDIAREMEERCPDAYLLNYSNPMAILCWAIFAETDIETVGLCHSVPHTVEAIAGYLDVPEAEIEYWVAGINHMAWFLQLEHGGEDLTPRLATAMADEETYRQDTVRFELFDHFGSFVTESSHHNSEYHPYFRTDPALIEELTGTGYAERMPTATYLEGWSESYEARNREEEASEGSVDEDYVTEIDPDAVEVERSEEYASRIIHSLETGTIRRLNLNVPNETGAIENLPAESCVEVPCLIDGTGIHPCTVGELPPQLAGLNHSHVTVQQLTVEGFLERDRTKIHQAVKLDPLTAAVCTLDEIHEMTEELFEANAAYLPTFE